MSISCGFYNSVNGDRRYGSPQMSALFDGVINDGVFMHVGGALMTTPGSGMSVIVAPGRAWFDRTWTYNDSDYPLTISPSEAVLNRIDAIILETNSSDEVRNNTIKVVKGTPGTSPKKPQPLNTDTVHQHILAYVTVGAGVSEITEANIEIMVGKTECPFVTAILETTDITDLMNQWQAQFDKWFANVEYTLSGDVAGKLQTQIDALDRVQRERGVFYENGDVLSNLKTYDGVIIRPNVYRVGDIVTSIRRDLDTSWLLCNGDFIEPAEYPELSELLRDIRSEKLYRSQENKRSVFSIAKTELSDDPRPTIGSLIWRDGDDVYSFILSHYISKNSVHTYQAIYYNLTKGQQIYSGSITYTANAYAPSYTVMKSGNIIYAVGMNNLSFSSDGVLVKFNTETHELTSRSITPPSETNTMASQSVTATSRFAVYEDKIYAIFRKEHDSSALMAKFFLFEVTNDFSTFEKMSEFSVIDFPYYSGNVPWMQSFDIFDDGSVVFTAKQANDNSYTNSYAYKADSLAEFASARLIGKNNENSAASNNYELLSDGFHLIAVSVSYNYYGGGVTMYDVDGHVVSTASASVTSNSGSSNGHTYAPSISSVYTWKTILESGYRTYCKMQITCYPIRDGIFKDGYVASLLLDENQANFVSWLAASMNFLDDYAYIAAAVCQSDGPQTFDISQRQKYASILPVLPNPIEGTMYTYMKARE